MDATPEQIFRQAGGTITRAGPLETMLAEVRKRPEQPTQPDPPPPQRLPPAAGDGIRGMLDVSAWAARDIPEPERLLGDLVTRTTRTFLVGTTGLGKTMFGLALACGMATGAGFLHWRSDRPARVLYLDGEMPEELIKLRCNDVRRRTGKPIQHGNLCIFALDRADEFAARFPELGKPAALNTAAGQQFLLGLIDALGGIDVIVVDNVMSFVPGNHRDEEAWNEVIPLIQELTSRWIGQIWIDHTGHDKTKQYGSNTKAWRFDSVGIMEPADENDANSNGLTFTLSFDQPNGKARRRTPDNWRDFERRLIRLSDDCWTAEAPEAGPGRRPASLSDAERLARQFLVQMIAEAGKPLPAGASFPPGQCGVLETDWRAECEAGRLSKAEAPKDRGRAFRRIYEQLQSKGIVKARDGWVWLAEGGQGDVGTGYKYPGPRPPF